MMARAALNNLANATVGRSAQIPHAARPSLGARCNRYRAALRLGWRDALRHKARTLLSLLLVMLPIAAMVASIGMTTTIPPTRSRALATIPADTQAVITATARPRTGQPFRQSPESGGVWQDDPSQQRLGRRACEDSAATGSAAPVLAVARTHRHHRHRVATRRTDQGWDWREKRERH